MKSWKSSDIFGSKEALGCGGSHLEEGRCPATAAGGEHKRASRHGRRLGGKTFSAPHLASPSVTCLGIGSQVCVVAA